MSLIPVPLALPDYARPAEAFQQVVTPKAPTLGSPLVFTVPGEFVAIPLAVSATFGTSNLPGNRVPQVQGADADGQPFYVVPASTTVGPSSSAEVTWMAAATAAWTTSGFAVAPLPPLALEPTWTLTLAGLLGATDNYSAARLLVIFVPTGTSPAEPPSVALVPAAATPVLA